MNETITLWLSLEYLNPEWTDCLCECEIDVYSGSGFDDDPSHVEVLSAKFAGTEAEFGIIKGMNIELNSKSQEDVAEKYFSDNSSSFHHPSSSQIEADRRGYR